MPNFTRFLTDPQFAPFAEVAVSAEKIYPIDPAACAVNCRRAVEFAVKWMYSVDGGLVMPYDDRLVSLMDAEDFRDIVGEDLWRRLKYIRQTATPPPTRGARSPRSRHGCAWKTSISSWTLSPTATGRTTPRGSLTQLCWRRGRTRGLPC